MGRRRDGTRSGWDRLYLAFRGRQGVAMNIGPCWREHDQPQPLRGSAVSILPEIRQHECGYTHPLSLGEGLDLEWPAERPSTASIERVCCVLGDDSGGARREKECMMIQRSQRRAVFLVGKCRRRPQREEEVGLRDL